MCAPALIPVLSGAAGFGGATAAGLTGAQLALATGAAVASGAAAGADLQAAEFNVNLAKEQQKAFESEAEAARIVGSQEAAQALTESEQAKARARTQFAAGGLDVGTGTAADVGEEITRVGQIEQMTILNNAQRQAFGLEAQGQQRVDEAKARRRAATMKGGTTILTSPVSAFSLGA